MRKTACLIIAIIIKTIQYYLDCSLFCLLFFCQNFIKCVFVMPLTPFYCLQFIFTFILFKLSKPWEYSLYNRCCSQVLDRWSSGRFWIDDSNLQFNSLSHAVNREDPSSSTDVFKLFSLDSICNNFNTGPEWHSIRWRYQILHSREPQWSRQWECGIGFSVRLRRFRYICPTRPIRSTSSWGVRAGRWKS